MYRQLVSREYAFVFLGEVRTGKVSQEPTVADDVCGLQEMDSSTGVKECPFLERPGRIF